MAGPDYIVSMDKSSKLPKLPLVLTGNLLRSGDVVYYDGRGWSESLADAQLAGDEPSARALETIAATSAGEVVDAYLVTVCADSDGRPAAAHYREEIRAGGPTIRFGEDA